MSRKPLPKLMSTAMYCCAAGPWRMLEWGVFRTASAARSKADEMCAGASGELRREITVERVYVSRRPAR